MSCSAQIRFVAALGPKSAVLTIGSPTVATVSLSANGVNAATVTTSPPTGSMPFSLGSIAVNSASGPFGFTITNASGATLAVPLAITGADPGSFVLVSTTCPTGGATLGAGLTCTASIKFAPAATGARFVNLSVGSPVAAFLSLTGTGI